VHGLISCLWRERGVDELLRVFWKTCKPRAKFEK
jgi:hypothetical protein